MLLRLRVDPSHWSAHSDGSSSSKAHGFFRSPQHPQVRGKVPNPRTGGPTFPVQFSPCVQVHLSFRSACGYLLEGEGKWFVKWLPRAWRKLIYLLKWVLYSFYIGEIRSPVFCVCVCNVKRFSVLIEWDHNLIFILKFNTFIELKWNKTS